MKHLLKKKIAFMALSSAFIVFNNGVKACPTGEEVFNFVQNLPADFDPNNPSQWTHLIPDENKILVTPTQSWKVSHINKGIFPRGEMAKKPTSTVPVQLIQPDACTFLVYYYMVSQGEKPIEQQTKGVRFSFKAHDPEH